MSASENNVVGDAADVAIDRMKLSGRLDGFDPVQAPAKLVKPVVMHGRSCQILREAGGAHVNYEALVPTSKPAPSKDDRIHFEWYSGNVSANFHASPENEQVAHDAAMAWADKTAHLLSLQDAASSSIYGEPDLVITDPGSEVYRELADKAVITHWETPMDEHGEGGLIDCLEVREDYYTVDITAAIEGGGEIPERDCECWIFRSHAHPNEAEIHVRCTVSMVLGPDFTGGKWLAVYNVTAVA